LIIINFTQHITWSIWWCTRSDKKKKETVPVCLFI
jgi:hypothetical protein